MKPDRYLEFLESDMRSIDEKMPYYVIAITAFSLTYFFVASQISGVFFEPYILFIPPYFQVFIFMVMLVARRNIKTFFRLLYAVYGEELDELHTPMNKWKSLRARSLASKVRERWETAILLMYTYFIISTASILVVILLRV